MGEDCILFLMFCLSRARLSCLLFFPGCQTKREERWRGRHPGGREEGGWWGGGGDGGAADMHLSPISSNPLHNSSALSLLPRLRTIRPDAH